MNVPKIVMWPVGHVIPYETNVKKHPAEQVAKIAESITRFGWDQPIVVDKHGVIIKGHGRRLAAISLGKTEVPVLVRADLTPEQVKAARLADNRAALSDIDPEMLRAELNSLGETLTAQLDGIFETKELEYLVADLGAINTDAFVEDMGKVVDDQKKDVDKRLDSVKGGRVPVVKALGFKDLPAAGQIVVSSLMARAEATTGLTGGEAFLAWAETQLAA